MLPRFLPSPDKAYAPGSLLTRLRARRFALFTALTAGLPRPFSIIDIGGTNEFWESQGWAEREDVQITLVNLCAQPSRHVNIRAVEGDATDLQLFGDRSFDVAFSNSVIEHPFTFENQLRMASEIRRVARDYWVQTPNYWFPIEPHFQFVGWQWLPTPWRVAILRRRTCGWRGRTPDIVRTRAVVNEVRLISRRELRRLFPDADLIPERFGGLTKSWVAVRGFHSDVARQPSAAAFVAGLPDAGGARGEAREVG